MNKNKNQNSSHFNFSFLCRESFPSLVGSLESIHSSKTLNPTLSQSAKAILRGDSLPEKRAENVTDDSISRKTKSLDTCHGIASHAEITEVEKHKTRPHFLRLRDIKRKHKKQSQSPPRARHRCWQSKESVEVTRKEIELNEVVVTDGLSDDPVKVPTTISLSLPSLHLGGMQETKEDQRAVGECSARKDSITDQESKFDGSNGSREKLSSLIDSPSVEFQSSRSPTCGDQRQGERVHCRSPNGDASPGRIRHLNSRSTEHNSK